MPVSFRSIAEQLPLLLVTLQQLQNHANSQRIDETTVKALLSVVDGTLAQVRTLEGEVAKVVPDQRYSTFQQRLKPIRSLSLDAGIANCVEKLQSNVQYLVFHQTTRTADAVDKVLQVLSQLHISTDGSPPTDAKANTVSSLKSLFMVPFHRDKNYVYQISTALPYFTTCKPVS